MANPSPTPPPPWGRKSPFALPLEGVYLRALFQPRLSGFSVKLKLGVAHICLGHAILVQKAIIQIKLCASR